jgi:DNA-binding XRE family transcriptional regulator
MDVWDLKKWRRKHRYNQFEAAERLGVRRASIQNWEREIWPIPQVIELACQELTRRWKQRPDFGPVLLVYGDGPIWQQSDKPYDIPIVQCQVFANNEAAIHQMHRLRDDPYFVNPFVMGQDGAIIWTAPELLRMCDKHRDGMNQNDGHVCNPSQRRSDG